MTNLDVSNSSTDSSSGSTSDSSSSGSSSTSSGSGSSSSDSDSSTSETPAATAATVPPKSPMKPAEEAKKKEEQKPRRASKTKTSSSEEEVPKIPSPKAAPPRRRASAKPKAAAAVLAKAKPAPRTTTGAKAKAISKTIPKSQIKSDNALKKKSIFSPDNSSESESENKDKLKASAKESPNNKKVTRKSSDEKETPATQPVVPATEDTTVKENAKRRSSRNSGPPAKKAVEDKSASSCSSSQSSIESVSSESDSEPTSKKDNAKAIKTKPATATSKQQDVATKGCEAGESAALGAVPRKLTRSFSARANRMATAVRPVHTDTDSDGDDKNDKNRDLKKNLKGRPPAIPRSPVVADTAPIMPSERCCPVRGCDSTGHLGGKARRHFTWDACPVYHNVTAAWCVAAGEERAAAGAARRRALNALHQRPRAMPTIEQRAYQLKVKDLRSKWKGSQELREKLAASSEEMTEEREPVLEGFAPDYDLRLFREAQALAAIKIEEELGDLPSDKGTRYVVMGKYMMEVWYQSPYPGDAARVPRLFVCEFCLGHHKCAAGAARHRTKCVWRHPPGDEVYRKDKLSVWQVDGRKHKQYCQQLCLLAKFFLDHKTLYYDVEPFLFYVMTCADHEGCHIVGYFSKEKNSFLNYNVSCILTLPPYQRQGYGRLLIDFSYLLTKVEGKVGSPETPLSDLGLISYRSYWKEALLKRLCTAAGPSLCIRDLSKDLAIASSDIVSTLQERGLMKYWKGKHIVLKKQDVLEEVTRRAERARCVDAACLRWWAGATPR
ncbi:PREDICTED: histone acetyltransferase KAT7 [Papilio xuthus]|uniref:Histone acetyltransferase n=1 Tax=Papilio xuthus TaxID=66420 RepID=A0AAJ6ZMJ4_PAPXU|nr:PREDICTED: histone acetyltransferase KAT7 [Papilio xuthus]